MLKRDYVIILLIIFIGIGLDYMSFQRNAIAEQRDTISQLSGRITLLSREVSEQSAKTSEAIIRLNSFDVIVREYLKAERRECNGDTARCLSELTAQLTPSELDCEPISDGICPR